MYVQTCDVGNPVGSLRSSYSCYVYSRKWVCLDSTRLLSYLTKAMHEWPVDWRVSRETNNLPGERGGFARLNWDMLYSWVVVGGSHRLYSVWQDGAGSIFTAMC